MGLWKPATRKIFPAAVFVACALFLYSCVRNNLSYFAVVSSISLPYALLICFVCLATLAVNGLFLKVLTASFNIDMHFLEYFSISIITGFGNIFLPMKGGAGFRAVYLKSRHNFDYSYFVSILAANYLIVFNINSVTALACLALFYVSSGEFSFTAAGAFLAIAAASSWAIISPPRSLQWVPVRRVREQGDRVLSGWRIIRKRPKTVALLCYLTALNLFLGFGAAWLEFAAFHVKDSWGNSIGFLQAAIFAAVGSLSFLISITPAALGIKESLLMLSSHFLGITQSQALAVSLLDRSVNIALLCFLFGFASIYINKRFREKGAIAGKDLRSGGKIKGLNETVHRRSPAPRAD